MPADFRRMVLHFRKDDHARDKTQCVFQDRRFSQAALEVWLATPNRPLGQQASSIIGAWKDDPYLDEMLDQIYQQRGRPMTEPTR